MINTLTTTFEGSPLQTLTWDERPCWVARHVGESIGYSRGGDFANQILSDWSAEFVEGQDFAFLSGAELDAFYQLSDNVTGDSRHVGRSGGRLLVLFESGANLALLKTRKPAGVKLRRFLADEVLPQITRTGRFDTAAPAPLDRLDHLERRMDALETAVTGIAQGVAGIAQGVQALLVDRQERNHARQLEDRSPGVHVHMPNTVIHISEPVFPEGFTIHGLKALAEADGCSHRRMRTRLEATRLWGAEEWHAVGQRTIPRGNRLDIETVYRFKPGILAELRRREAPLFA